MTVDPGAQPASLADRGALAAEQTESGRPRPAPAAGSSLRTAIVLIVILLIASLLEIAPALFALVVARGADPAPYRLLLNTPGAALLLGRFLDWDARQATALLALALARSAILFVCTAGLVVRRPLGYFLSLGTLVLDVLWTLYRLAGGYIGPIGAAGNAALALAIVWLLFTAEREFYVKRDS
jgi:hypothetical protein